MAHDGPVIRKDTDIDSLTPMAGLEAISEVRDES